MRILYLSFLCILFSQVRVIAAPDLVYVWVRNAEDIALLRQSAVDLDEHHSVYPGGQAVVYADAHEQAALRALGFELHVEIEDLPSYYAQRAAKRSRAGGGSMGGFRTLAEIETELDRLTADFPDIVSRKFSIGQSHEGRDIWAIRISDYPNTYEPAEPVAWFDALHHAREPMSGESLLLFARWLGEHYPDDATVMRLAESRNILLIPCVNPDGYEYNRQNHPNGGGLWRKNRRDNSFASAWGVDLNRNYNWAWGPQWAGSSGDPASNMFRGSAPFSEPETAAIRDLLAEQTPLMSVSVHSYGNEWMYPWGYQADETPDAALFRAYADAMTAANGYASETAWELYGITNGVSDDYQYGTHGTLAFTAEVGAYSDGFWPAPSRIPALFDAVRPALLMLAQWSGAWAELSAPIWTETAGNGDAWFDPGEAWSLYFHVKNQGSKPLQATLTISSPSLATPVVMPLNVPPRMETLSGSFPIRFDENIAEITLHADYEGAVSTRMLKIRLGPQRRVIHDDMESENFGWEVARTDSTWEYLVPEHSVSDDRIVLPGDDDSGGKGTHCWMTTADTSADSTTWLTSPVFRADGLQSLELEYARWFASRSGAAGNGRFVAEASNDGGAAWTVLEEITNVNAWQTVRFDLTDYFPALSNQMQLRFRNEPDDDLTEACIDDFVLRTHEKSPVLAVWGPGAQKSFARIFLHGDEQVSVDLFWSFEAFSAEEEGRHFPGIAGTVYLTGEIQPLFSDVTDTEGLADWTVQVPVLLSGRTVYLQALLDGNGDHPALSTLASVYIAP